MAKNTDLYFTRAKEYQDKRAAIISDYEKKMRALEDTKGSKRFDVESKAAENAKETALKDLQSEYRRYFDVPLKAMERANATRGMTPPTDAELRILQLLKMKEKPTEEELKAAANSLKGNAVCLSVLSEISRKAGYLKGYEDYSEKKEITPEAVKRMIQQLNNSTNDFLQHETSWAARQAREYHEEHYGTDPKAKPLSKRNTFDNEEDCFNEIAGFSGDLFTAFCNAVNN